MLFNRKILLIGIVVAILIFTCSASAVSSPKKVVVPTKVKGSGLLPHFDDAGNVIGYEDHFCDVEQLDNDFNGKGTFGVSYSTVKDAPIQKNGLIIAKADYVRIEGDTAIIAGAVTKLICAPEEDCSSEKYFGAVYTDTNPDGVMLSVDTDEQRLIDNLKQSVDSSGGIFSKFSKGNMKFC